MLRVVGAGLGRTGTNSLKLALERLLGGPCYHMFEVLAHLDHVPTWRAAIRGEPVDWQPVLGGYVATVDWPAATCWRRLADANPDALVLLSSRADAQAWWRSADDTIFAGMRHGGPPEPEYDEWRAMAAEMMAAFEPGWSERDRAVAAYERHLAEVRASVPSPRLLEWQPGDGWTPLCTALDVPVPDEPFPHVNTTAEFQERVGQRTR